MYTCLLEKVIAQFEELWLCLVFLPANILSTVSVLYRACMVITLSHLSDSSDRLSTMLDNCSINMCWTPDGVYLRFPSVLNLKFWSYDAPIWSRLAPPSGGSAEYCIRLELPLGVFWNANLQLVCCFCVLRRGFSAEGEEGVRQSATHAANSRKRLGRDVLEWWEMMWIPFVDWKQLMNSAWANWKARLQQLLYVWSAGCVTARISNPCTQEL